MPLTKLMQHVEGIFLINIQQGDKEGICPKLNIIARLELELVYYDVAVQHISYYMTGTFWHYGSDESLNNKFQMCLYKTV